MISSKIPVATRKAVLEARLQRLHEVAAEFYSIIDEIEAQDLPALGKKQEAKVAQLKYENALKAISAIELQLEELPEEKEEND